MAALSVTGAAVGYSEVLSWNLSSTLLLLPQLGAASSTPVEKNDTTPDLCSLDLSVGDTESIVETPLGIGGAATRPPCSSAAASWLFESSGESKAKELGLSCTIEKQGDVLARAMARERM
jgi:hypothetical protein